MFNCIIMGAAGRDFHDFRSFFIEHPAHFADVRDEVDQELREAAQRLSASGGPSGMGSNVRAELIEHQIGGPANQDGGQRSKVFSPLVMWTSVFG